MTTKGNAVFGEAVYCTNKSVNEGKREQIPGDMYLLHNAASVRFKGGDPK
ncbi:hypothetical protein MCOR04_001853 [Pyricularia oryzae]|nr:hypothetical protein MCOR04_001853 [Pyricularia oryzae]